MIQTMPALAAAMLLLAAPLTSAQEVRLDAGFRPPMSGEVSADVFGIGTYRAPSRGRRYAALYGKAELSAALQLAETFSIRGVLKFEPVAGGRNAGQDRAFQDQGAYVGLLFAEWQAHPRLSLQAGKFTAPFGRGWDNLPGIRLTDNASGYEIAESLGAGGRLTWLDDAVGLGEHTISAAAFTLDTTSLSSTFISRKRFGRDEADRFSRNSRGTGGAGNSGRLDNAAVALSGEDIGALPGFSCQVALLSRAAGVDGTAREWGTAASAARDIAWAEGFGTTLFGEAVRFRNAGGRPVEDGGGVGSPISERRTITTPAALTTHGPWRAALGWQVETRERSANGVARATYLEASVGQEIGLGCTADIVWSRTRDGEDGRRGDVDAALALVG